MTQVTAIFTALAAMVPTWDSDTPVTIKVWNGAIAGQIKATLPTASVPIRILSTTGDPASQGRDFGFIALGKLSQITWTIEDLLLIKAVAEGDNIKGVSHHITAYCDSYVTKIRDLRSPAAGSIIRKLNFRPGIYPYDNKQFFGVLATVEVQDYQSAA